MTTAQLSHRHHYVPQFYLRQWAGPDGMLWQYKRERSGKLSEESKSPKATSFRKDLYSVRDVTSYMPQRVPDAIESQFLARLDDQADKVLKKFLSSDIPPLTEKERTSWSLFLNSLHERDPRVLRKHDAIAPKLHETVLNNFRSRCDDAESRERLNKVFEKFDHQAMAHNSVREHMVKEIRDKDAVDHFRNKSWTVITIEEGEPDLLTSDSPLLINCGQRAGPANLMSLPLSPDKLLLMCPEGWFEEFDDAFFNHFVLLHNFFLIEGDGEYLYSRGRIEDGPTVRLRFATERTFGRSVRVRGG